jgi:hypothetical protein
MVQDKMSTTIPEVGYTYVRLYCIIHRLYITILSYICLGINPSFVQQSQPIQQQSSQPQVQQPSVPANLDGSLDDVGKALEMFSFRLNNWERIDIIDYEATRKLYKCQFPNGTIQWLDLTKKPVRAMQ